MTRLEYPIVIEPLPVEELAYLRISLRHIDSSKLGTIPSSEAE